jgi:hypothetical protein
MTVQPQSCHSLAALLPRYSRAPPLRRMRRPPHLRRVAAASGAGIAGNGIYGEKLQSQALEQADQMAGRYRRDIPAVKQ